MDDIVDYDRANRYYERQLKKLCDTLRILIAKPSTNETVSEVREYVDDLVREYNHYRDFTERAFGQVTGNADAVKKEEDTICNNLEALRKLCLPMISKGKFYVSEFDGERTRQSLNNTSLNQSFSLPNESNVKLPRINVPKFSGNIEDFLEFYELFRNVIHDEPSLSKVRKFYYLKESLEGEAAKVIKDIPLSERGYDEAWGLFVSTFKDIKKITRKHFDALFSINRIKNPSDIPNLLSTVNRALKGLKACGEDPEQWQSIVAYIVSEKLDERTYEDFEKSLNTNANFPKWKTLRAFLELRASITKRRTEPVRATKADTSTSKRTLVATKPESKPINVPPNNQANSNSQSKSKPKCLCCMKFHLLIECSEFMSKTPEQRYELLKPQSVCLNCFKTNHRTSECNRTHSCKHCSQKHHSLLHFGSTESQPQSLPDKEVSSSAASCVLVQKSIDRDDNASSLLSVREPFVILPSALVIAKFEDKSVQMRVLLDSCSQMNLISKSFINRHNIHTREISVVQTITGIGNGFTKYNRIANLCVQSNTEPYEFNTSFYVINHAIPYSVHNLFTGDFKNKIPNLKLAEPEFLKPNVNIEIDALLGIEAYDRVVRGETMRIGQVCLRNTRLGWTLSSMLNPFVSKRNHNQSESYCGLTVNQIIDQRLTRFWETEEVKPVSKHSPEAEECNKHFEQTYSRDTNGRFVVRLPFKDDPNKITNNRNRALSFLKRNENRLNEPVKSMYYKFMSEYSVLGHMSPVSDDIPRYFLPHHSVMKPDSTTTKLRVVFNASSKSYSNLSLNDILMIGPMIQPELFDILLVFQTYAYAYTADVTKMYRCILVHPEDRRFQSILWYANPGDPNSVQVNELNTVTYGTAPASFQATKCLEKLADEMEKTNPKAAKVIRTSFLMDDLVTGAQTIDEAIEIRRAVHDCLLAAGFELRKYQSNSTEILADLEPDQCETNLNMNFGQNEALSILGLAWSPYADTFNLKFDIKPPSVVTKRSMLSLISKIYDPMGFASPVVIRGKRLFQSLWKLGIQWDDIVPDYIATEFRNYLNDLTDLYEYAVPRCVQAYDRNTEVLVGFCDSSETAYCAAIYAVNRTIKPPRSKLLCSKTRVAPVKVLKIPELELQAAVLLVELINRIRVTLEIPANRIELYSDSTIVLSWLSRPPTDWKTFVRNRVSKIVNEYPVNQWSHVRSGDNPADLATRGLTTRSLIQSPIWLTGPAFILNIPNQRSCNSLKMDQRCESYRSKPKVVVLLAAEDAGYARLIEASSSFAKLLRSFAIVRAICRVRRFKPPISIIEARDMEYAFYWLIRITQKTAYQEELERLRANRNVSKRSSLIHFTPFIDTNGILRSKSRLQNARIPFNQKCPILLPAKHRITVLYVTYLHERYFHATRPFLLSYLSSNYAFIGGISQTIKSVIRDCVTCRRYFHQTKPQIMADLPPERVTPTNPFQVVGVDFTGAFTTKCNYHRTTKYSKSYAAIFICFSTRAVHVELVPSLSTEDFLNALKCFVSRRGIPSTIFSDNGTNFRGAERYLSFNAPAISKYVSENFIQWKFNPPYTPHRGGIWESAVKSAKRFIPIVTKGQLFTENELRTLLIQIESLLNSRPLAYTRTSEPVEEVLTPGHFLIGRNLNILPDPVTHQTTISLSERYRANVKRIRDFWKLWSTDYLNQLRTRSKWTEPQPNLTEGQVVLLKDRSCEPGHWKLGRVTKLYPDLSNHVRTVDIKTADSERTIPVTQAIPIPEASTNPMIYNET